MSAMRKFGVIGGLSWVSTAAYYKRLNEITAETLGGVRSARIVVESVDRQDYVDAVIVREDEDAAYALILDAARNLETAGASFVVISCNDVHRFVPRLEPEIGIPFLHIADAARDSIRALGITRVAVLGVRKTMEGSFYAERLAPVGIEMIALEEREKAFVHETIYDELVHDIFSAETRARYASLIGSLAQRGVEGVVLGCTELPLLLQQDDTPTPLFDTVELHCRAAIERALA